MNAINDSFLSSADRGVLRLITAGSVDDGKSTLIGRLLYDSKGVFADQLDAIARAKYKRVAGDGIDFSLLTDGLEAEREQASPSTWPTDTSRPRCASSSSPTRRGMSSTRATW